jgi:hypothetical protein
MSTNPLAGYILLSMPTDQIQPLSLLTLLNKRTANMTGVKIGDLFEANEGPMPHITKNLNVSSTIDQSLSLDVDLKTNLSFLESLLEYVNLSLSMKFQKESKAKINLLDAKKDIVNEFHLDAFINGGRVKKTAKSFVELLEKNELYVVTDILKCKKFSVEYQNGRDFSGGLSAESPGLGGGSLEGKKSTNQSESMVNESESYLTFGVKAYRIFYIVDKKTGEESYRIRKENVIKTVLDDENFPGDFLEAQKIDLNEV